MHADNPIPDIHQTSEPAFEGEMRDADEFIACHALTLGTYAEGLAQIRVWQQT